MELTDMEKRLLYQVEGCEQYAVMNEIFMSGCYAKDPARKEAAHTLLDKLRPLSDRACMDLVRDVQKNYRLPQKARTVGEMLAEARQRSGAEKLKGHDIMALERFDSDGRFSYDNKTWAKTILVYEDNDGFGGDRNVLFVVDRSHPGLVDLFLTQVRRDFAKEQEKKPSVRKSMKQNAEQTATGHKPAKRKEPER